MVISGDIEFYKRTIISVENVTTLNRRDTEMNDEAIDSDADTYE